jgi:hypothetical protein
MQRLPDTIEQRKFYEPGEKKDDFREKKKMPWQT